MHAEHSNLICFLIGLGWALIGAFGIFSFFSYDHNRLTEKEKKFYIQTIVSSFLFGAFTILFVVHATQH